MHIKIEENPQNNVLKIYLPQPLVADGKVVFVQTGRSGLLRRIWEIENIDWCLIIPELLAIKYNGPNGEDIKALLLAEITDYFAEQGQLLPAENEADRADFAQAVADVFIRPTLNRDKGDVKLKFVSSEQIEAEFVGHCAGCPYAQNTLQNVVMKTLQKYLPEVTKISLKETV